MALIPEGTDCYQLIECMYKCKHFKNSRRRFFKGQFRYSFEQEILVLERVEESWKRRYLFNNKRCNCNIKKAATNGKCGFECDNNPTLTCLVPEASCSYKKCASMTAHVLHGTYISPVTIITTERSNFKRQWAAICPSWMPDDVSTLHSSHFPMTYGISDWTATEEEMKLCGISNNYLQKYMKRKINLLTYKKTQPPINQRSETVHQEYIDYFLVMMFVMVVKEVVQYISEGVNRMRHKSHFVLPILILLQLLMTAPSTNCTSPHNQTITAVILPSASLVSAVALVSDTAPTISSASTITAVSPTTSSREENAAEPRVHQQQTSAISTPISNRPTGGSSITSYISHEGAIRRDLGISFMSGGCHSCQMREQVKADNLESIKRHILLRLEMHSLPNITAPPIPYTIIENFYKNHSQFENKKFSFVERERSTIGKSSSEYVTLLVSGMNGNEDRNDTSKNNDNNMQGDDPNIYSDDYSQGGDKDDENDVENHSDDEFFSIINSVYVFPTIPRMRHNRKTEILNFQFKNSEHTAVSHALLHVYIRGSDWIREYEPSLFNAKKGILDNITISVNRVVRRINSTIATHTVKVMESKHKISSGIGEWISLDITQLVEGWLRNSTSNEGIVIKGSEAWMKSLIIIGDSSNNKAFTVHIEVLTKDNRKRRSKRNTSMNCSESDNEERCCRYPLVVNFVEFEWKWVVAPTSFNAYFCNGECKLGFLEKYPHTHLMQLSTAPQPCCSPTKMSPLRLLYFNAENTLVMSTIPNMAVEKCSCS